MKKIALAVCALALLSACGERGASSRTGEKPVPDAAQARAEIEADHAAAAADIADAERTRGEAAAREGGERRIVEYKQALLPMIARSYAGACSAKSGRVEGAAIKVTGKGTLLASGFQEHSIMGEDARLTVTTETEQGSAAQLGFGVLANNDAWGVVKAPGDDSVIYTEGGDALKCVDEGARTRPAPLFPLLARFFSAASASIKCSKPTGSIATYKVVINAQELTIGDDSFALGAPDGEETALVDAREQFLMYSRKSDDNGMIQLQLNAAGKLARLSAIGDGAKLGYSCSADL